MNTAKEYIFFSQDAERLAQALKERLFEKKRLFVKKFVVVPSLATKDWLMQYFAHDSSLQFAGGLHFLSPDLLFDRLFAEAFPDEAGSLSGLELALLLESHLRGLLDGFDNLEQTEPLRRYLAIMGSESNRDRIITFAEELARLFRLYGLVGPDFSGGFGPNFQHLLWQKLFEEDGLFYPYKCRTLPSPKKINGELYFFNCSFLPKTYHYFLNSQTDTTIYHYFLSPCLFYWEDICSDREKRALLRKAKKRELEPYLADRNVLLANMGKKGKEHLRLFSAREVISFEDYPTEEDAESYLSGNGSKMSLLGALQTDLLFMRNPESGKKFEVLSEPRSLEVHIASSKLREVQVLYNNILDLGLKEGFAAEEILVLSPDIEEYAPYIQMVFNGTKLAYKIADLNMGAQSFFLSGLLGLLDLAGSRFEKKSILALLENPAIAAKFKIDSEMLLLFKNWVATSKVSWGLDAAHRQKFLAPGANLSDLYKQTWQHFFDRLWSGLLVWEEFDEVFAADAVEGLDFTSLDAIEPISVLFEHLKADIAFLEETSLYRADEWAAFFKKIAGNYLEVASTYEESAANKIFDNFLFALNQFAVRFPDKTYAFASILRRLKKTIGQKSASINASCLHAVRFASLKDGNVLSAHLICVLGMQHSFPSLSAFSSLNLASKQDFYPSESDEGRYLFLQLILMARKRLLFSFTESEEGYSILLEELYSYMDEAFIMDNESPSVSIIKNHPYAAHDAGYFQGGSLQSFSIPDYRCAKKLLSQNDAPRKPFCSFDYLPPVEADERVVHLRDLNLLAKHPIQFYLNKTLNIYLENEEEESLELKLGNLDKFRLRQLILTGQKEKAFDFFNARGVLGPGVLGSSIKLDVERESGAFEKMLDQSGLAYQNIFQIELVLDAIEYEQTSKGWRVPAPLVSLDGKEVAICGIINQVAQGGALFYGKNELSSKLRFWPQLLIYNMLDLPKMGLQSGSYLLKDGNRFAPVIADPKKWLQLYLQYYFISKKTPSPLLENWSEALLKREAKDLRQAITQSFEENQRIEDLYLKRAFWNAQDISSDILFERWTPLLRKTFEPLI